MAQDPAFPNAGSVSFGEDPIYRLLDDLVAAGVVAIASDYQVIQNHLGANMSVDVNPGSAYVSVTNGGKRRTRLPAQSNSGTPGTPNAADNWLTTFTASDPTNPRIDRVVLTVRDSSVDGSGAFNSALRVIAGTPTTGATLVNLNGAAAVPPNSILLANVLVPNSATTIVTANIADGRPVARLGGNLPTKTTTSLYSAGPPASPNDGDIWIATAVDTGNLATTNGARWMFQYNASSGSTYKWEFIGGMPLYIQDMNARAVANVAVWTDWPVAMSMTVARAGEYDCIVEGDLQNTGGTPAVTLLGLSINGVDPASKDNIEIYSGATGPDVACSWTYYQKAVAAGGIIKLRYQSQLTSTLTNAKASYVPRRII